MTNEGARPAHNNWAWHYAQATNINAPASNAQLRNFKRALNPPLQLTASPSQNENQNEDDQEDTSSASESGSKSPLKAQTQDKDGAHTQNWWSSQYIDAADAVLSKDDGFPSVAEPLKTPLSFNTYTGEASQADAQKSTTKDTAERLEYKVPGHDGPMSPAQYLQYIQGLVDHEPQRAASLLLKMNLDHVPHKLYEAFDKIAEEVQLELTKGADEYTKNLIWGLRTANADHTLNIAPSTTKPKSPEPTVVTTISALQSMQEIIHMNEEWTHEAVHKPDNKPRRVFAAGAPSGPRF